MLIKAKGVIVNHSSIVWNLLIPWGGIYSSSKAAVKQLSEILRVELEPLGVRPIRQFIVDQREAKKQPKMEHVDVTARHLVNDVLGGAKGLIWRGAASTDAKWLSWLLPSWALEMATNGTRGLSELRHYYAKKS
ncbi:hypothetical protein DL770_010424 [Monosporascus sp. CRB-9-2]|nr:hypothetical protein DL770_010424 [Monosporascus sp. CRB-9-2]